MRVSDFDFYLPKHLIAQHPSEKRDHSRLLVIDRENEHLDHYKFYNITSILGQNDVLVINDSKVIPARLMAIKETTDAHIEVLLTKEIDKDRWEALCKPAKRVKMGSVLHVSELLKLICVEIKADGIRVFDAHYEGLFIEVLEKLGEMPLPPYITEKLLEKDRYQTVYAKDLGSAAAPTAGLHFTKDLLQDLKEKGVTIIPVTLHVGIATFRPVSVDSILDHHMHEETYTITKDAAEKLNQAKREGKKITCVGTTTVRTLESNYIDMFHAGTFQTNMFIFPGYNYKACDHLITNFHLPKSTLIMLVSAFMGKDLTMRAYKEAIDHNYRFFSFGDAMLIK